MEQIKYFIVADSVEEASKLALMRYIDEKGGAFKVLDIMQEEDSDIIYFPEFYSSIPHCDDSLFIVIVSRGPSK